MKKILFTFALVGSIGGVASAQAISAILQRMNSDAKLIRFHKNAITYLYNDYLSLNADLVAIENLDNATNVQIDTNVTNGN